GRARHVASVLPEQPQQPVGMAGPRSVEHLRAMDAHKPSDHQPRRGHRRVDQRAAGRAGDLAPGPPAPRIDAGSALVVWDAGKPNSSCSLGVGAPPLTNTPPVDGCPAGVPSSQWGANDPHEFPRNTVAARLQKSEFDEPNGKVYDVCGGQPCHSTNYSGIP